MIRSIISYGSVTWVLNKNICKQLAIFERKIMRRIFGAIETEDGGELDIMSYMNCIRKWVWRLILDVND